MKTSFPIPSAVSPRPSQRNRPLRVMYFARAPFVSGAERALLTSLRGINRNAVEPALILGCESDLLDITRQWQIPVEVIAMPKRSLSTFCGWRRSLRAVRRAVGRFRPDLVHANDVPSCQAMSVVAGRCGIPRIVHIRWPVDATAFHWWARGGIEQAICISQWVRDQLSAVGGSEGTLPPNILLPDPVSWTIGDNEEVEKSSEELIGPLRLGFAGQLIEAKGLDLIIHAVARIPERKRPYVFVAGEDTQHRGTYRRHLQELTADLGVSSHFEWLGFLSDVTQLYRRVDAMICPSRIEPLGLVPLEAAQFSIPSIVSAVGGFRESVLPGQTGYLVQPTVEGWIEGLTVLGSRTSLQTLGQNARRHVQIHYGFELYQQRLLGIYRQLAIASPPPES